jgi:hypothetical protein
VGGAIDAAAGRMGVDRRGAEVPHGVLKAEQQGGRPWTPTLR